ncbi:uncharacterized protein [Primulina huaijiensis]|uniref:uncharacterized protein n=1 Tax=Primulina huaijiensis TaxID=1492673 RepID=UPI003CC734A1
MASPFPSSTLIECSESKLAESSNSRNWNEAFQLYSNAITCGNDGLKVEATIKLAKMSRHAPENILALTVPLIVGLLESPLNPSILEASAYCLKCLASQGDGRLAHLIGQSDAIPLLLNLLPNTEGRLQISLLKCLRNLVTFWDSNSRTVASNHGLEIVLRMLNSSSDVKDILYEILSALALTREVRRYILNSRNVYHLVEAANCGRLISRTRAAQAIGLLGLIKSARPTLVDAGAIPVLVQLLKHGDPSMKLVAGNALGVIASHIDHINLVAQAGVIPLYVELLQGSDPIGQDIAVDVLCILAVNEENAITIAGHLVELLRGGKDGAKAGAVDVIRDMSNYKHSMSVVENAGAIPILVELLKDENTNVKERVSGAIAQLSCNKADRVALANSGAIPILLNVLLEDEPNELIDNAVEALVNFSADPSLGEQISCISESPLFQNMRYRVLEMGDSDESWASSSDQTSVCDIPSEPDLC